MEGQPTPWAGHTALDAGRFHLPRHLRDGGQAGRGHDHVLERGSVCRELPYGPSTRARELCAAGGRGEEDEGEGRRKAGGGED